MPISAYWKDGETSKPLEFRGSSLDALKLFPEGVRVDAGRALWRVQNGEEPADWKPIRTVGVGVSELRIRGSDGAYRVFYLAKMVEAVYVLHCFQKKTQQTSPADIDMGRRRLADLLKEKR